MAGTVLTYLQLRCYEGLGRKVSNPITELVVAHSDEGALLATKSVEHFEGRPTAVKMGRQVGWINSISQEEVVPPLLRP